MDEKDRTDELAVAQDLRRQIQERHTTNDYEGLTTAKGIPQWMDEHAEMLRKVAFSMGYLGREADDFLRRTKDALVKMDLPSPLDEPMLHAVIKMHCADIEAVCQSLGLHLRSGVAFGVNPGPGLEAMQLPVPLTEAGIVSISRMFVPFCGIVSKALARSLPHDESGDDGVVAVSFGADRVLETIRSDRALTKYWFDTIASFALFGEPTLVKPDVLPSPKSLTRAQLLTAMELFAIAHEYGHHIANRRLGDEASAEHQISERDHSEEFEADFLACVICTHVALRHTPQNPYGLWGVGGVLMLKSLELVRRARCALDCGADDATQSDNHPPVSDRILAMETFNEIAPDSQKGPSELLRRSFEEVIGGIWKLLSPMFSRLHEEGVRPIEASSRFGGWLPT